MLFSVSFFNDDSVWDLKLGASVESPMDISGLGANTCNIVQHSRFQEHLEDFCEYSLGL